jgi:holo-[acyl-carrier protein] synthase
MIVGIGTDIVTIERIKALSNKCPQRFVERLLTPGEREIANSFDDENRRIQHLAKRYAAKEAISKALGTGIGTETAFHDIVITSQPGTNPIAKIDTKPEYKIHLSISDEIEHAIAFAVIELIAPVSDS